MTDLDTLRRALQAQQDPGPGGRAAPDPADIMVRGRRLRLRRRLTAAGGAVCAAAIVFGVASGISQLTRPSPVPAQHSAVPIQHPPRHTHLSTPVPVPSPSGSPTARAAATSGLSTPVPMASQGASSATTPSEAPGAVPITTLSH